MAVTVRIVPVPEPVKVTIKPKTPPPTVTLELDIRKSLSGDLMIFDHGDIKFFKLEYHVFSMLRQNFN